MLSAIEKCLVETLLGEPSRGHRYVMTFMALQAEALGQLGGIEGMQPAIDPADKVLTYGEAGRMALAVLSFAAALVLLLVGAFRHLSVADAVTLAARLTGVAGIAVRPTSAKSLAVGNEPIGAAVARCAGRGGRRQTGDCQPDRKPWSQPRPVTVSFTAALSDVQHLDRWALCDGVTVSEIISRALVFEQFLEDEHLRGSKIVLHRPGLRTATLAALERSVSGGLSAAVRSDRAVRRHLRRSAEVGRHAGLWRRDQLITLAEHRSFGGGRLMREEPRLAGRKRIDASIQRAATGVRLLVPLSSTKRRILYLAPGSNPSRRIRN